MKKYRTHTCWELNKSHKGKVVSLSGWINKKRDHGNLLYIDLRDNYGITQCIIDKDNSNFYIHRFDGKYYINTRDGNTLDFETPLDANGDRRTLIHPRCKELIKALRTLTYAPNTGLPNKNLGVDHAFDAFGYLCLQQFNLAKPETLGQTSFRIY